MARLRTDPWAGAVAHLLAADHRFGSIVARVGPCRLRPKKDRFGTLVRAIIGQQISTKAAASIDAKLKALSGDPHEPEALLKLGDARLRTVGLSGVKAQYVLNLADAVASDRLPLRRIGTWDDETIIARMTEIKGIGRWTAEMFLIFALNRPDVLPIHDLGIRVGFRNHCGLDDLPKPMDCVPLAEPWRPYRTVAMWYFWRSLDKTVPPAP
jgi:DNA-3-methyladenine glycosylase II